LPPDAGKNQIIQIIQAGLERNTAARLATGRRQTGSPATGETSMSKPSGNVPRPARAGNARPPLRRLRTYSGLTHYSDFALRNAAPGTCYATMAVGQWDALPAAAYETGAMLLELNDGECVIACYQREGAPVPPVGR
jgi:hypothetical protein